MDPAKDQKPVNPSTLNQIPEASQEPSPVVVRREPERDIVVWTAPARPFKRHDRKFYVTTFAMAGIVSLVIFLAEGIMPVILIISLVFLYYVLSTVRPEDVEYKVTTKGVKIAESLTPWQNITRFWFVTRLPDEIMVVETVSIPGRIEIVINQGIKSALRREMSAYVSYEEATPSTVDKVTDWFSRKLPGNS
jgi:hypothetical protein